MKKIVLLAIVLVVASIVAKSQNCTITTPLNKSYSKAAAVQSIIDNYTKKDLPGISVAVYTEKEGWWTGSSGYAKVEIKLAMNDCHLQYIQSVAKTYMAVAIMKLYEDKKIDLNAFITKYLPASISSNIRHADKITVEMLLNHTSGIAEYVSNPAYISQVILRPLYVPKMEEVIRFIANDEPRFAPGAKYAYTNTNYMLLAMIADVVTGDHASYIDKIIFKPLQLKNTFNRAHPDFLRYSNLVDTYWDVLNTGLPANVTPMQRANVESMIGDDGIVATPVDVIQFFKGLNEGKIIREATLKSMQQWQKNSEGYEIYGYGIARMKMGEHEGIGHGGGGIGAGCALIYIPKEKTYIFLATNVGVVWDGLPAQKANQMKDEVFNAVLNEGK